MYLCAVCGAGVWACVPCTLCCHEHKHARMQVCAHVQHDADGAEVGLAAKRIPTAQPHLLNAYLPPSHICLCTPVSALARAGVRMHAHMTDDNGHGNPQGECRRP